MLHSYNCEFWALERACVCPLWMIARLRGSRFLSPCCRTVLPHVEGTLWELTKPMTKFKMDGMMATQINVHEAKTQLSKLLARVEAGEEIVIAKAGRPIARLVPFASRRSRREPGTARGQIALAPDFDEPLPDDRLEAFEA